ARSRHRMPLRRPQRLARRPLRKHLTSQNFQRRRLHQSHDRAPPFIRRNAPPPVKGSRAVQLAAQPGNSSEQLCCFHDQVGQPVVTDSLGHKHTEWKSFPPRKLCQVMPPLDSQQANLILLGQLLTNVRTQNRRSQTALARSAGCTQPQISRVENGERPPSPEIVSAYLQLTGEDTPMRRRLPLTAAAAGITSPLIADEAPAHAVDHTLSPDIDTWDARIAALGRDNMQYGSAVMRPHIGATLAEL